MRILLALAFVACSSVKVVPLAGAQRPSLSGNTPIDVVVTGRPKCAFDEIALMTTTAPKLEVALERFRDEARSLGAPQVILRSPSMPLEGTRSFEALAVLPDCERLAPPQKVPLNP